jgi:type I restriction enzyme M protein
MHADSEAALMSATRTPRNSSAGPQTRIRVPQHVAELVIELAAPRPADVVCDPAAGACELLAIAAAYVREHFPASQRDADERDHFARRMFHGFDRDAETLRAGAALMHEHGVEHPQLERFDLLAGDLAVHAAAYTLVVGVAPFGGSAARAAAAKDLPGFVRSKRLELLFVARVLQLLAAHGRGVVIVPETLLSGSTQAHVRLRSTLLEAHRVDAVIALPAGLLRPDSSAPAAILVFTKAEGGGDSVWFSDLASYGWSLQKDRVPLLAAEKLGPRPRAPLTPEEHECNNLPDLLERWRSLGAKRPAAVESARDADPATIPERERARSAQSFCVSRAEIAAQAYDLSVRRYRSMLPTQNERRRPHEILAELAGLEAEIFQGMKDLVGMLK